MLSNAKDFLKNYISPEGVPGTKVMAMLLKCVSILLNYCYANEVTFKRLENGQIAIYVDSEYFVKVSRSNTMPTPVGHA